MNNKDYRQNIYRITVLHTSGTGSGTILYPHPGIIRDKAPSSGASMNEKEFQEYWRYQDIDSTNLFTETGEPVRIIYPGRPNDIQGADFRDAVISTGNRTLTGNVELHLKSGDWRNHKHHLDPHYNSVILHVVRQHNARTGTILENGTEIPVLELGGRLPEKVRSVQSKKLPAIRGIPCSGPGRTVDHETLLDLLDTAGKNRFLKKANTFKNETRNDGKEETLYRGIMTALGYSGNKAPFAALAEKLPLAGLESAADKVVTDDEYLFILQVRLLGTAGFLLPGYEPWLHRAGITTERGGILRRAWEKTGEEPSIPPDRWQLCMIRPHNSPVLRLNAMAHLMVRYRQPGLKAGITGLVRETAGTGICRTLENGLEMKTLHPVHPEKTLTLLGKNRAGAIAVNVLLPFLYVTATTAGEKKRIIELYGKYPKPGVNSLEKHLILQLGIERKDVKTAVRQQGLLHIYHEFCIRGRCRDCGLGQLQPGDDVERKVADLSCPEAEISA